jgi:hypothetical protein
MVLVWLGNASRRLDPETSRPYTDIAADFIRRTGDDARAASHSSQKNQNSPVYEELEEIAIPRKWTVEDTSPLHLGMQGLFWRPWWSRVWVLQELALAPAAKFFCGGAIMEFDDIRTLLLYTRSTKIRVKLSIKSWGVQLYIYISDKACKTVC